MSKLRLNVSHEFMSEINIVGARAVAVILRGPYILLMKRVKADRTYLIFGGGTIEPGETKEAAVTREVSEEFGLSVSDPQFLFELTNEGRKEFWFLLESHFGVPVVGGPEQERASSTNQYIPTWYALKDLKDLSGVYPQSGQAKVVQWLLTTHRI